MILFTVLFFSVIQGMHHVSPGSVSRKLKYDTVTLTNNSSILLELVWIEISPQGRQEKISHNIKPDETITVRIGEVGGYYTRNTSAKIIYAPIKDNPSFKQEFTIDLPNSSAFVFTVKTLADIMNNIWVPGVLQADDKGNFNSFQYMNLQHPSQWEKILLEAGKVKTIKY